LLIIPKFQVEINLASFSPKLGENFDGTLLSLALFWDSEYIFAINLSNQTLVVQFRQDRSEPGEFFEGVGGAVGTIGALEFLGEGVPFAGVEAVFVEEGGHPRVLPRMAARMTGVKS
jgi:hypothetical protein